MAVPEGYTEVGLIGLVNKGNYDPLTEYSKYNFVYYQGSTYLYINELPQSGVTPSDDGVTWQYMSRGMMMDNTPTQGSPNAVTSGGIYDSERALKTEIQNEQTAATTKATDTNNVLGQGPVTNATNVQALLDNVTDKDTNPTKDSAKTVISGGVYSADKATREMIAPVEENATSSAPYAIGEQLIFNGVLCEATSAISIGDTLAMGTNLSTANKITNRDSTPTANSTKLVTSGGVYSADNQIRENIANVETSPSTHAYAVGKQLIFNGLLCKVTSAISVGDTLAVGTNLALSDNVVEQIYSLNQGLTNSLNEIADMNNVLGAKNLLPNIAETKTVGGVTRTANADGSITLNGTSTGWGQSDVLKGLLPKGTYKISIGTPLPSKVWATLRNDDTSTSILNIGNGSSTVEGSFTLSSDTNVRLFCGIEEGATLNNFTFYPMLRPASIQDDTYVPYSMTNREMTPYVQAISNPNLLDNPWFTVNQRGQSSYTIVNAYSVDRWKAIIDDPNLSCTISINSDNSLTVSAPASNIWFIQYGPIIDLELLKGKTITLSVDATASDNNSGRLYSSFFANNRWDEFDATNIPAGRHITSLTFTIPSSFVYPVTEYTSFGINIYSNKSITIHSTKLEIGSVSTLHMDTAPNYQQELAKCQRYFQRIKSNQNGMQAFYTIATSSSSLRGLLILQENMRNKPTITISDITGITLYNSGTPKQVNSLGIENIDANNRYVKLTMGASNVAINEVYAAEIANGVYIDFSADL